MRMRNTCLLPSWTSPKTSENPGVKTFLHRMALESKKEGEDPLITDELQEYFKQNEVATAFSAVPSSDGVPPLLVAQGPPSTEPPTLPRPPPPPYGSSHSVTAPPGCPPPPGNDPPQTWPSQGKPAVLGARQVTGRTGPRFPVPNSGTYYQPPPDYRPAPQYKHVPPGIAQAVRATVTSGGTYGALPPSGGAPCLQRMPQGGAPHPTAVRLGNAEQQQQQQQQQRGIQPGAYHNLPVVYQSRVSHQPQPSPTYQGRQAVFAPRLTVPQLRPRPARRRGRPRLNFSAINVPRPAQQVPIQGPAQSHSPLPGLASVAGDRTPDRVLSPPTPAFIDTDFNKDLFAEAEQQLAEMQTSQTPLPDLSEIMDLSTSGELPITSPSPNQVQPSLQAQPQALVQTQSTSQTQSTQQSLQSQSQSQPPLPLPGQLPVAATCTPTGTLVGQNLIVQQCPVQSVSTQQILPLSQPQLAPSQLPQAHTGLTQQPHVVPGQMSQLRGTLPQQQVLQSPLGHASITQTQLAQAQLSQAQLSQPQLSQPQLSQPQFSQAQLSHLTQVRLPQGSIRLSQPGTPGSLSQAQLSTARALSPAQALSLIRPQQMTAVSLSLTSAQTVLGQAQAGAVTMATGTHHPQAAIINMNSSLAGATLFSQPIQVLTTTGYQQMMSMPVQLTAGQGGQTVLMPLQQPGSVLHPAGVGQVLNTTLNKTIQPRPTAMLTMPGPNSQQQASTKAKSISGLTPAPLTIPVGMVSTAQVGANMGQNPRTAAPPAQQVLNIPRLQLTRPGTHLQTLRASEPRHTFVLQQPLRSPPEKMAPTLQQIRPREIQPNRSPKQEVAKIVAIQPQGQQVQVLQTGNQAGGTVLLATGFNTNNTATPAENQLRVPTSVTSPLRIARLAPTDDVPLNLDTKTSAMTSSGSPPGLAGVSEATMPAAGSSTNQHQQITGADGDASDTTSLTNNNNVVKTTADNSAIKEINPNPVEEEDPDFVWEDYLEETGAIAAPPTSFTHVEDSLKSGIQKGMVVEVSRNVAQDAYWLATIVMTCGPLLRLRYAGYDEGAQDFWLDVGSPDMHPVGWGSETGRKPHPPEGLQEKIEDWPGFIKQKLEGATIVPAYLLDSNHGVTPVDQMKPGQRLEVQHELDPGSVWVVRIMENVGGRLLLRYEGTDRAVHDMWLFYLHFRLHPIGWAKDNDCIYKPPEAILSEHQNYSQWSEILQASLKEASENSLPPAVFTDQEVLKTHAFQKGWKLEALHPNHSFQVCPATVVRITSKCFVIEIDSVLPDDGNNKRIQFCCHGNSANIFPVLWAQTNGLRLTPPTGWKKQDFDWELYLTDCNSIAAPDSAFNTEWPEQEFSRNMKLEAVNPGQPGQVCAASITRIIGHLLWIHLDSCAKIMANHLVHMTSQDIFPVGWCASNGYPLKPPRKSCFRKPGKKVAVVQPDRRADGPMSADEYRNATYSQIKAGDAGSSWCPKIYFNHKCFSGPFLSKGRIAELPRCVGPGPIPLVLKEVLSMLINVAYKSSRVLRELQQEGPPDPSMQTQTLKAKYKGKSYCAIVEMCRTTGQIELYCRQICLKLECCPNLFSTNFVNGNCPENCSQLTKTKYTCYYGKKKKRKIGRPPGGHSNLENGPIKLGKRRRKRRMNLMVRKKSTNLTSDTFQNGDPDDVFEDDKSSRSTDTHSSLGQNDQDADFIMARKKRKYEHRTLPPSIIKTRGAKLPRYSFERRTHKKIMLSPPPPGRNRAQQQQHTSSAIVMSPKKEPLYDAEEIPKLESNPLHWSVMDVVGFIKTTDCAHLARLFRDQAIDGQALLMLTLPAVQDHMDLKLGPAIKLCHHIEQVKIAFYEQFAK